MKYLLIVFTASFMNSSFADLVATSDFKIENEENKCWKISISKVTENKSIPSMSKVVLEVEQIGDLHACCLHGERPYTFLRNKKNKNLVKYPLEISEERGVATDSPVPLQEVYDSKAEGKPYKIVVKCD